MDGTAQRPTFGRRAGAPPDTASTPTACRGCGRALQGPFCHACGQAARGPDRLSDLLWEFVQRLTRYDRRIWKPLLLLVVDPGRLSREWNEGARAGRLTPLHLALFSAFLLWVLPTIAGWRDPNVDASGPLALANASAGGVRAHAVFFCVCMAPALTLILKLVCAGRGATTYQHAVVALHEVAFILLWLTAIWLPTILLGFPAVAPFGGVFLLLIPAHLIAHLVGAYRVSIVGAAIRSVGVLFLWFFALGVVGVASQAVIPSPRGRPPATTYFTRAPAAPPSEPA